MLTKVETKERPILFSSPMVRALLDGRKTQTRRIIKPQPYIDRCNNFCWNGGNFGQSVDGIPHKDTIITFKRKGGRVGYCPHGQKGDHLWVRETFAVLDTDEGNCVFWRADGDTGDHPWKPSIHMPRWASRILLEITDIRVERLTEISKEDAKAEGAGLYVPGHGFITERELRFDPGYSNFLSPRLGFETIWTEINGPDSWNANPWVWAISFRRVQPCA